MINRPILFKPRKDAFAYPYSIGYGGRFDNGTARLNVVAPYSSTDSTKKTFSVWLKRGGIATLGYNILSAFVDAEGATGDYRMFIRLRDTNGIQFFSRDNTGTLFNYDTVATYPDPTHFMHLFFTIDAGNATQADRLRVWVNGVEQELTANTAFALNAEAYLWEPDVRTLIGRDSNADQHFDGVMSEIHYLDGTLGSVTDFGEFIYNTWVPKEYTAGNYGANGIYLAMSNQSDLGEDFSGNNNDMNAISVYATLDSPTSCYPTLDVRHTDPSLTVEQGALVIADTTANPVSGNSLSTFGALSGKWYFEAVLSSFAGSAALRYGVAHPRNGGPGDIGYLAYDDTTGNGTYRVALDLDNDLVWFGKGSSWTGNPETGQGGTVISRTPGDPAVFFLRDNSATGGNGGVWTCYYGAEGFNETVPAGFSAMSTDRLPLESVDVVDGERGLWLNTRTGTGAIVDITGAPFDLTYGKSLVWTKNRDQDDTHNLVDTVRGATKELTPNNTAAETVNVNGLTAFNSSGFSLGTGANGWNDLGEGFLDMVFNMHTRFGADIVTYIGDGTAGRAIGHNLGAVPEMMIVKRTDDVDDWHVYHKDVHSSAPEDYYLKLNTNDLPVLDTTAWGGTAPTDTEFTVSTLTNTLGATYIVYLFRSRPGYMHIGYWTDAGSADGSRIHTCFRPQLLLYKRVDTAVADWGLFTTAQQPYNSLGAYLLADKNDAEATTPFIDILSNGFKRIAGTGTSKQVYLAIGLMPFPYCNPL